MLPRLAIATATTPTGQTPAASGALASGRVPAAEVIANLRAEVLLRLVETMLKQLQRGQSQNGPANALLEILLDALKTMPAGRGEGLRDIAAILTRVPAEARPAVERLLHKTIAALPTRILVEILRNPESPAAQKLASMIAILSSVESEGTEVHGDRPRAIAALEAKLAESHTERRPIARREGGPIGRGDARALQAELRRLFEPGSATQGLGDHLAGDSDLPTVDAKVQRAATALERAAIPEKQNERGNAVLRPTSTEARPDSTAKDTVARADMASNRGAVASPVAAAVAMPAADGDEIVTAQLPVGDVEEASSSPETRKETQAAAPVTSRAAVTARAKPEAIVHFITAVVASLSDDEAQLLKVLLERPIARTAPATGGAASVPEQQVDVADTALPDLRETQSARRLPDDVMAMRASPVAEEPTLTGERTALPVAREATGQATEARIDPALIQGALRETIVPVFVPYMPAQDDAAEESGDAQAERDEDDRDETGQDEAGEDGSGSHDGHDAQDNDTSSDDPATLKKREKIADLVGPPDPGFAFYQKLGEYWA